MLEPTIEAVGLLVDVDTLHLDRGYDYPVVRDRLAVFGLDDVEHPAARNQRTRQAAAGPSRLAAPLWEHSNQIQRKGRPLAGVLERSTFAKLRIPSGRIAQPHRRSDRGTLSLSRRENHRLRSTRHRVSPGDSVGTRV